MKTEAFTRLNGRQETPILIKPDGSRLTETMGIAAWLEARDSDRCISFDPKSADADCMHRMLAFMNTSFMGAFSPLWAAMEMKPDPPLQEILRKHGRASVFKRHAQLEAMLDERPFIWRSSYACRQRFHWGRPLGGIPSDRCQPFQLDHLPEAPPGGDPAVIFVHAVEDGKVPRGSGACAGYVTLEDVNAMGCEATALSTNPVAACSSHQAAPAVSSVRNSAAGDNHAGPSQPRACAAPHRYRTS